MTNTWYNYAPELAVYFIGVQVHGVGKVKKIKLAPLKSKSLAILTIYPTFKIFKFNWGMTRPSIQPKHFIVSPVSVINSGMNGGVQVR